MKVLVAEPMSPAAIALLQSQKDWDVVVSNPKEYEAHLADCDALLVRSAVKVKACRASSNSGLAPSNRGVSARFKFRQLASSPSRTRICTNSTLSRLD